MERKPYYKGDRFLQDYLLKKIPVQADKYWIRFYVPIVIIKEPSQIEFHLDAPTLEYQEH